MNENKLYAKVMGIEEARKRHELMPPFIKIPKHSRLTSSGGHCGLCGQNNVEGHEDGHGKWHYRCTNCVSHQKPDPNPCPRCRCTAHERICDSDQTSPFKPDVINFRCLNCEFEWPTPEYEKYLLIKTVKSISPKSEFSGSKF